MIAPGSVVWVDIADSIGREQCGRCPWIVISSRLFLHSATSLVTAVPCTTRYRPWAHRVAVAGDVALSSETFAATEQVRTLNREGIVGEAGIVDDACLTEITRWVRAWIDEPA